MNMWRPPCWRKDRIAVRIVPCAVEIIIYCPLVVNSDCLVNFPFVQINKFTLLTCVYKVDVVVLLDRATSRAAMYCGRVGPE